MPVPRVPLLPSARVLCSVWIAPHGSTLLCSRFSIAAFTRYDPVAPAVTFTMFSGKVENAVFPPWLRRLETMGSQREITGRSKYNKESKRSHLLTLAFVRSLFFIPAAGSGADSTPLSMPIIAGIIVGFLMTLAAIVALVYWKQLRSRR